jgi:hypothetical protein
MGRQNEVDTAKRAVAMLLLRVAELRLNDLAPHQNVDGGQNLFDAQGVATRFGAR